MTEKHKTSIYCTQKTHTHIHTKHIYISAYINCINLKKDVLTDNLISFYIHICIHIHKFYQKEREEKMCAWKYSS